MWADAQAAGASSQAIEPPPAPIAFTSTIGTRTGKPAMLPCARITGSPPSTSAMSLDVPPTSMVIRSRCPDERPTMAPPITPAAGPDRNSRTGRLRATMCPRRRRATA